MFIGVDPRLYSRYPTFRRPCGAVDVNPGPEVGSLVSGYGFSRAANRGHSEGFSPCLFKRVRRTCALGLPPQRLKPSICIRSARLKPCLDTEPILFTVSGCGNSASPKLTSEFRVKRATRRPRGSASGKRATRRLRDYGQSGASGVHCAKYVSEASSSISLLPARRHSSRRRSLSRSSKRQRR